MDKGILVIVESPAKSTTLSKYLGPGYTVSSSMGHVRDLPAGVMGIDLKNNFQPSYIELPEKKPVIRELKKKAAQSERILLASDPDREGEAIAFHLREILLPENSNIWRIMFNEITRSAVLEAVSHPQPIDMNKVDSQQMRRLLDRLAGYKISPILQRKIGGPLSAGRVQSIALKLIVEREKEIRRFVPEEYWTVEVRLEGSQPPAFTAKLEKWRGKGLAIENGPRCEAAVAELNNHPFVLDRINRKAKLKKPPPPLITSSLQQEAFRRFKFPIKRTMKLAQELYEGMSISGGETTGLITYMRTDSFRIAEQVRDQARQHIETSIGREYYPAKANLFKSKAKIQDAHECIRPTFPFHHPDDLKNDLNPAQHKIYQLIWNRFFASQMAEAKIDETRFDIVNGDYLLTAKGEVVRFDGFLKVLGKDIEENELPPLTTGETLRLLKLDSKQNFTKPPARYSEATLVKVLEEKGIGRPSTYAKIIETLGKREYVFQEEKKFIPTELGIRVVDYLEENFQDIMNYNFTANLEKELDQVSEGKLIWTEGIDHYYRKLEKDLLKVKNTKKVELLIDKQCPKCGHQLIQKYSIKTRGWFIGCSHYPECTYTEKVGDHNGEAVKDEILERSCPTCNKPLVKRYSRKSRQFFIGCSGFPNCNYSEAIPEELGPCPLCGKPLNRRFSPKTRRFFIGCSGYPECRHIQKSR